MILTGTDIETTGLNQEDGHKIIEICFLHYDLATRKLVDSYTQRINPERSIDPKAQAVHGIGLSDLLSMPTWSDVHEDIYNHMEKTDLLIAHNMKFDGPFIALELMRSVGSVPKVETFCTMENARWATPLGKNPNLGELCFALGVPYDKSKAHSAEYDVDCMMACFFAGYDRGFYELPGLKAESVRNF